MITNRKRLRQVLIGILGLSILIIGAVQATHLIRRLQDNSERNAIVKDMASMKEAIEAQAAKKQEKLTTEEVRTIVESPRYTNPHTKKAYIYVTSTSDYRQLKDGEVAYGAGICGKGDSTFYFAYHIGLRRVQESTGSCAQIGA
jgi:hypothetical protein